METYEDIIENRVDLILLLSNWLFKITLGIGSLLFLLLWAMNDNVYLLNVGIFYIVIAFVINAIAFILLIIFSFVYPYHQKDLMIKACMLLLNLPIAFFYLYLGISYINSKSPF
ncbi:MAG: hypothetical protein DI539_20745 [Flavobacterium psychrophilum]|nr:MAG: hypothetical protein DI539_20745 [Flavobacterium psychrophilum]